MIAARAYQVSHCPSGVRGIARVRHMPAGSGTVNWYGALSCGWGVVHKWRRDGVSFIHSFIHIRLFSVVKTQPNMN